METNGESLNNLYTLLEYYIGGDRKKISPETKVNFDLGLEGDDADEFLNEYSEKFKVNLSNFEFNKYFQVEGYSVFNALHNWIFLPKKKQMPLTIGQLIIAIEKGVLE